MKDICTFLGWSFKLSLALEKQRMIGLCLTEFNWKNPTSLFKTVVDRNVGRIIDLLQIDGLIAAKEQIQQ